MTLPRLNNLTDLIDLLDNLPPEGIDGIGFDMAFTHPNAEYAERNPGSPCGSACCIAGWVKVCNSETWPWSLSDTLMTLAGPHGASYDQCRQICVPPEAGDPTPDGGFRLDDHPFWDATPQQAAKALRILRDEGVVDLDRAMEE